MLKFSINRPITNVAVFGCGGTGSRAVPLIAQLLTSHDFTKNVRMILVDGDVVEEKNCKRQLFIKQEIDKNKAEVIARRYKLGFEARTEAVPYFVPSVEEQVKYLRGVNKSTEMSVVSDSTRAFFKTFLECFAPVGTDPSCFVTVENFEASLRNIRSHISNVLLTNTSVFVMCVDSVDARKRVLTLIQTLSFMLGVASREALANMIVIDAGNEDIFGQVSYFNPVVSTLCPFPQLLKELPDRVPYDVQLRCVPFPIGKYMNMKDGESTKSCADLDQTMAINNLMAAMIAMIFQNLLYGLEMDYHTVNCNLNGSFYTDKFTMSWLKGVMSSDESYLKPVVDQVLAAEMTPEEMDLMLGDNVKSGSKLYQVPMYFGLNRNRGDKGLTINDLFNSGLDVEIAARWPIGARTFLYTGDQERNLREFSEAPPGITLENESYQMWKYSNFAHVNWANMFWPTLMQGIKIGFIPVSDVIKEHAVLCYGMTIGPTMLHKAIGDGEVFEYLESNYHPSNSRFDTPTMWSMIRADLIGFGKHDLSSPSYKDAVQKNLFVDLKGADPYTAVLPNNGRTLVAGCNLMLNTSNAPGHNMKYVGSTYAIICEALLASMTPEEIRGVHNTVVGKFTIDGRVRGVVRRAESMILGRTGFVIGNSVKVDGNGGVTLTKNNKLGLSSSHTKGITVVYDHNGQLFGDDLQDSDFYISSTGRVVKSEELKAITVNSSSALLRKLVAA